MQGRESSIFGAIFVRESVPYHNACIDEGIITTCLVQFFLPSIPLRTAQLHTYFDMRIQQHTELFLLMIKSFVSAKFRSVRMNFPPNAW
jgi:hypothetical protein